MSHTFGYFQRPLFLLGVSKDMQIMTNLWTFWDNYCLSQLQENNERRKTPIVAHTCMLLDASERLQAWNLLIFKWDCPFLKYYLLKRAVSYYDYYYNSPLLVVPSKIFFLKLILRTTNRVQCLLEAWSNAKAWSNCSIPPCFREYYAIPNNNYLECTCVDITRDWCFYLWRWDYRCVTYTLYTCLLHCVECIGRITRVRYHNGMCQHSFSL